MRNKSAAENLFKAGTPYSSFKGLTLCKIFNPLRSNSDLSETSHYNIKGLSVSEVMRNENMITDVKFY